MEYLSQAFADIQTAQTSLIWLIALATLSLVLGMLLIVSNFFDPVRLRFLRGDTSSRVLVGSHEEGVNVYEKYRHILLPSDQQLIGRTSQRLQHAGFHFRKNLYQYYALRLLLMVGLPTLSLVALAFFPQVTTDKYLQIMVLAALIGYVGPSFGLDRMIANRQKTIQRAFPDALDLLLVCTEAGLSLDASFQKVTSELGFSQPILAEEFNLLISEIRAGIDRKKAFTNLAERTGVDDIRGLMSAINQSMRFGSSISQTLRVYSEEFRDKRMQAAEEKAAKIGVKLLFPTALCLLPCFILIVLVPVALSVFKALSSI